MPEDHPNPEDLRPVEEEPEREIQTSLDEILRGGTTPRQEPATAPTSEAAPEQAAEPSLEAPAEPAEPSPEPEPAAEGAEPVPADQPPVKPAEPAEAAPPVEEPAPEAPAAVQPPLTAETIAAAVTAAFQQQEEARQRAEAARNQPEPPDPEVDPAAAYQYHQERTTAALNEMRLEQSYHYSKRFHDDFDEVCGPNMEKWKALTARNPHLQAAVQTHEMPFEFVYDTLKREQMLETINTAGGLDAYTKAAIEKHMASLPAEQPAAPPASPPNLQAVPATPEPPEPQPVIPQMMGNEPSAAPSGEPKFEGEMPLEEILRMPDRRTG